MFTIKIDVSIPALDRWIDFQEGKQQVQIDAMVQRLVALTDKLHNSETGLAEAVSKTTLGG